MPATGTITEHRLTRRPRSGTVAPFLLISMMVFLGAFAFAVNKAWLWSVREDVRVASDSAAHAAALALADDDLLRGDPNLYPGIMERATAAAMQMGRANPVRGHPFPILDNPANDPRGDIVFGALTRPRSNDFLAVPGRDTPDSLQGRTNTVVVSGRLTRRRGNAPGLIFGVFAGTAFADIQAVSAATLDRGVLGFQPRYGNIPLAPIALRSSEAGDDAQSWEAQVENGAGPDLVSYSPDATSFLPRPDGIHEYTVVYATDPSQQAAANAVLLHLPDSDLAVLSRQLTDGITAADLNLYQGRFILPDVGTKDVAAQQVGPSGADPGLQQLAQSLELLSQTGAVRVWPLYQHFNAGLSSAGVSGFVAARVVRVTPPQQDQPLVFVLQATVLVAPTAVTDTDLHGANATRTDNRYICRVRRIE